MSKNEHINKQDKTMDNMQMETRLIDLTLSELTDAIAEAVRRACNEAVASLKNQEGRREEPEHGKKKLVGLDAIAEAMCSSKGTVQRWMRLGLLEGCYKRINNKIIVEDERKLLEMAARASGRMKQRGGARKGNRVSYSMM